MLDHKLAAGQGHPRLSYYYILRVSNTMTDTYIAGTQNIFAGQMKEHRHEQKLLKK